MKIAIVSLNFRWQSGGSRQILELARHLKKMGHKVVIYATSSNKGAFSSLQKELDVRTVAPIGLIDWSYAPNNFFEKVSHKISQWKNKIATCRKIAEVMDPNFDVINCHDYAYPANFFYKKLNPKVRAVMMMCEPPYSYLPKKEFLYDIGSRVYNVFIDIMERKYIRAADVTATLAPYEKEWVEERGGKGIVVWSGLDFGEFYSDVRRPPSKSGVIKLMAIGIPSVYRRYEDTIMAVSALHDEGYKPELTIVANNLWKEDDYCEKLISICRENDLEKIVDLKLNGVSEEELKDLYKKSHVLVYTNYVPPGRNGATWALVVSEAQAAGMPVVLYKNTGAAEPLTDGENAMLAETLDKDDVARKIKALVDDPKLYERVARNGQEFVKNNISWEKYTERMLKLFRGEF